jgi:Carboxypeptidase regulatory-like domain
MDKKGCIVSLSQCNFFIFGGFMFRKLVSLFSLLLLLSLGFINIIAQDDPPPPKPTPTPATRVVRGAGNGSGVGYGGSAAEEDDDGKLTAATIRGKVVYEDTGRPLRFVAIGFIKTDDVTNTYTTKFVKTDENGDFVIKNVKAGSFYAIIKSDGILNPTSFTNQLRQADKKAGIENLFEKTEVAGLGEFQVLIRAKRGGSIIGRVNYADGEVAVGVKVEALIKNNNSFQPTSYGDFSVGTTTTDDRGFYRFAGLPDGKYIVRVTEPVSHKETKASLWEATRGGYGQESQMLVTYYPDSEKADKATQIDVGIGQEQSEINFNLPERKLFRVTGKVVGKQDLQPLKNFDLFLYKVREPDNSSEQGNVRIALPTSSIAVKTDSVGNWAVRSLLKGKYEIRVSQPYVYQDPNKQSAEKPAIYPAIVKEIEITDKDISDFNIEIPLESSISGVFVSEDGKPLPKNLNFYASTDDRKGFGSTSNYGDERSDSDNLKTFKIGKLIAGKYKIFVTTQEFYITAIKAGGSDVTTIELKEGEEIKNVQIVLSNKTGTLKGKVDGYDPKDRAVVLMIKSNTKLGEIRNVDSKTASINPKGEFEIRSKAGEYSIVIITDKNNPKTEADIKDWLETTVKAAPKVEIKIGQIANVTLKMPSN